jgi:hypothetical protein
MSGSWAYIKDKEDWDHFCAIIDNNGEFFLHMGFSELKENKPYFYFHSPEPDSYPCLCHATFSDDPNGPYCYDYEYVSLEDAAMLLNASLTDLMSD